MSGFLDPRFEPFVHSFFPLSFQSCDPRRLLLHGTQIWTNVGPLCGKPRRPGFFRGCSHLVYSEGLTEAHKPSPIWFKLIVPLGLTHDLSLPSSWSSPFRKRMGSETGVLPGETPPALKTSKPPPWDKQGCCHGVSPASPSFTCCPR